MWQWMDIEIKYLGRSLMISDDIVRAGSSRAPEMDHSIGPGVDCALYWALDFTLSIGVGSLPVQRLSVWWIGWLLGLVERREHFTDGHAVSLYLLRRAR